MRSQALTWAVLAVLPTVPASGATFCNTSPITIDDSATASPYPSAITVAGVPPGIHSFEVTINQFSHTFPDDVGMVLVGPGGEAFLLEDGAGGDDNPEMVNVTYTVTDNGTAALPDDTAWVAGRYKPANYYIGDLFPVPGPGTSYANPGPALDGTATFASTYATAAVNGTWNLFVKDFITASNDGSIAGGWCLTVLMPAKGDMNLDNSSDLLFQQASSPGHHEAWLMNGTARLGAQTAVTPDAAPTQQLRGADQFVAASAGTQDLVWWDSTTGAVEFWSMNGLARVGSPIPLTGAAPLALNWRIVATADFNGDNMPDLMWRNTTSQNLVIWTLNGTAKTGNITPNPSQAVDANWRVVAALDYNADGARDLLWYNDTSGKIVVWYMNASVVRTSGAFTNPASAGDANWKVVAGGEYGPGVAGPPFANDIVWRNDTSGKLVIWNMDTAGNRVTGGFTTPDAPTPALDWNVVGPK